MLYPSNAERVWIFLREPDWEYLGNGIVKEKPPKAYAKHKSLCSRSYIGFAVFGTATLDIPPWSDTLFTLEKKALHVEQQKW